MDLVLLFLEFFGGALGLSEALWAVVLLFLVGVLFWYKMFGFVGIVVLVVVGPLMGPLLRPEPTITLDLKPEKPTPKAGIVNDLFDAAHGKDVSEPARSAPKRRE